MYFYKELPPLMAPGKGVKYLKIQEIEFCFSKFNTDKISTIVLSSLINNFGLIISLSFMNTHNMFDIFSNLMMA